MASEPSEREEVEEKKRHVGETLRCPHCDALLSRWRVPQTPFTEWPSDFLYVCLNNECPYYVRGWEVMRRQGVPCSNRFMYEPTLDNCYPIPVFSETDLLAGVLDDDEDPV